MMVNIIICTRCHSLFSNAAHRLLLIAIAATITITIFPSNYCDALTTTTPKESSWQRRTAKRRERTEQLLNYIEGAPDDIDEAVLTSQVLQIPSTHQIKWDNIDCKLDPMHGGKIQHESAKGKLRGERKRAQIEAFYYILSSLLDSTEVGGVSIIDAGCGAGNLAIGLSGLLTSNSNNINCDIHVLAVDINEQALKQLEQRAEQLKVSGLLLSTCCADLSNIEEILSHVPSSHEVIVTSLHACGSASDMAINLAIAAEAPFIICPCCTAKSLQRRPTNHDAISTSSNTYKLSASFIRSGATSDIEYPRSSWLRSRLVITPSSVQQRDSNGEGEGEDNESNTATKYTTLAKVADVGLGPQTPTKQRAHQIRAKNIVEMDRLKYAAERYGYSVRLMRIDGEHHDPLLYGKGDILLASAPRGAFSVDTLACL